ncbi:hypothetical protein EDC96DRAFT_496042 [Choanephora cucurbitarum]|nr:hypothetical protein EDC96DRAFT_496042 [Choanephora cucurbitarum]
MRETEDEEEICRVCRSEATPEQPLFHPCKCAGSIRYVHQDCLTEWLAHSRKKYCELCEHPFNFTPVYREDMPDKIPARLFIQQLRKKLAFAIITILRMLLVSCIWLVVLPYFTIWTWRLYFSLGASLSRHLSRLQQVKHQLGGGSNYHLYNDTMVNNATQTWLEEYKSRLTLQSFLADCFEGQVITCIVIIVFVAVFLLREWIVQNIPMEAPLNEDDELILDPHPIPAIAQINLQQPDELIQLDHQNMPWQNDIEPSPSPSPVASPSWHNDEEIPSLQIGGSIQNEVLPYTRASSLPPTFSRTSSFHDPNPGDRTFEFQRAASLEPFNNLTIGSRFEDTEITDNPFMPPELFFQGNPPNAPRMRHAEAPIGMRPILEENEHAQAPVPLEPQEPVLGNNAENNNNDVNEGNEEEAEEFEGILEAIGMQGSLWSLLQNCTLMGLLIALSLGAAVWMPYLIGMLFIMTEAWDMVRVPLKIARLITDPFVDLLFWVSIDVIGPYIQPLLEDITSSSFYSYLLSLFSTDSTSGSSLVSQGASLSLVDLVAQFIEEMKPGFHSALQRYQALAIRQTAFDRFACIAIGYAVVAFFSCWYLTRSAQHRVATVALGRTAQEAIRHQGIIFKVSLFIAIELVLFPIVCGYLLEFSTLPLFKQSTAATLQGLLSSNPVPSVFLHWFLGTGFMFVFAVLVNFCRDVLRPGVMWFIRDPNDPQFHPIREIIERPALFQLRKIISSAFIYLAVIMIGVGGMIHALDIFTGHAILPLRWNFSYSRIPLSVVPVDIIILQIGIPAVVRYFKPKVLLKKLFISWMKFTCRQLRLSSFMFGQRRADEEGALVYHTWTALLRRAKPTRYPHDGTIENIIGYDVSYMWEGQLLRVPRHDSVPVTERRRMLVPVDPITLLPLDETERRLGHPAANGSGDEEVNTTIVYSPPHFKQRLFAFVGFMWLSSSFFLCSIAVMPVLLGRTLFEVILNDEGKEVHDIYSFFIGSFVLLFIGVICYQIYNTVREITSQATLQAVMDVLWRHTKQWSSWIFRWSFFAISFGVLIPLNLGILVELYSILPLKKVTEEEYSVELATMWAHGFAFMILLHGVVQIIPNNRIRSILNNVFREGIHNMNVKLCITRIVGPFLLFSLAAIGFPSIIAYINLKVIARANPELRFKFMQIVYPAALIGVGSYYLTNFIYKIGTRLADNIREDNYLIGRTLHNLDH